MLVLDTTNLFALQMDVLPITQRVSPIFIYFVVVEVASITRQFVAVIFDVVL